MHVQNGSSDGPKECPKALYSHIEGTRERVEKKEKKLGLVNLVCG